MGLYRVRCVGCKRMIEHDSDRPGPCPECGSRWATLDNYGHKVPVAIDWTTSPATPKPRRELTNERDAE